MRSLLCLIALIGLVALPGCNNSNKPTPDTVTVAGGRVDGVVSSPVMKTAAAARKVAVELKLTLVQYTADDKAARLVAYTETSQRIEIDIRPDDKGSHITVQTEGRGGEVASNQIMTRIRKSL